MARRSSHPPSAPDQVSRTGAVILRRLCREGPCVCWQSRVMAVSSIGQDRSVPVRRTRLLPLYAPWHRSVRMRSAACAHQPPEIRLHARGWPASAPHSSNARPPTPLNSDGVAARHHLRPEARSRPGAATSARRTRPSATAADLLGHRPRVRWPMVRVLRLDRHQRQPHAADHRRKHQVRPWPALRSRID